MRIEKPIRQRDIKKFIQKHYPGLSLSTVFREGASPTLKKAVLAKVVKEFSGYYFKGGKLTTFNPYTNKHESLQISSFNHIRSKEELVKELSMLRKTRQSMLRASKKRITVLAKTKDRDQDLSHHQKSKSRLEQLNQNRKTPDQSHEQER